MPNELPAPVKARIENISDDELAFRGWTRGSMREAWLRRIERDKNSPQIGDVAPDFKLELLSQTGVRTGEHITLSSLRGKPVGLIFGSYT